MIDYSIKFKNLPQLDILLDNTLVTSQYKELLKSNYQREFPLFRDQQKYTVDYLKELASKTKQLLGWDWDREQYTLAETTLMHKDIERYLANGFNSITNEHDQLCHELHFCLHAVESNSTRDGWLQIEWFNDDRLPLPELLYPKKLNLEFGDIRLQNPHVGHHPLYLFQQNDYTNIMQTCKFHNYIKPGINIVTVSEPIKEFNANRYLIWFKARCPEFVELHGEQAILNYTGHPIIGKVVNLDDLVTVSTAPILELESITFNY
jgi:hypothetical protein